MLIDVYKTDKGGLVVDFHPSVDCEQDKDVRKLCRAIERMLNENNFIETIKGAPAPSLRLVRD